MNNYSKCNAGDTKTGFYIGQDYAFYGLPRPESRCKTVIDAYYEEKQLRWRKKRPSIYDKKWLSLRLHAYERGIHFDDSITPEHLKEMFIDCGGVCPVTLEPLTQGQCEHTDWSIDRIINDYAYTPNNIVVMSTGANKLKGCMTFEEIKSIASQRIDTKGLTDKAWSRLYNIAYECHKRLNPDALIESLENIEEIKQDPLRMKSFFINFLDHYTSYERLMDDDEVSVLDVVVNELPKSKRKRAEAVIKQIIIYRAKRNNEDISSLLKTSQRIQRLCNSLCQLIDYQSLVKMGLNLSEKSNLKLLAETQHTRLNRNN